jgi:hypothetical protein
VHVEADPNARHLEAQAVAWDLPFPDDWADEILSIHTLKHVCPRLLQRTLRAWHCVLASGGGVRVHVPNSPALMHAYLAAEDDSRRWMLSGALLGMYGSPAICGPKDIPSDADHQILLDRPLLFAALEEASFGDHEALTQTVSDRHTDGWKEVVDRCSIVAQPASNPVTPAERPAPT